ncbi:MAG: GDP-mannose 4,6-dehydratase [Patescibacteria group bacterium]
MARPKPIFEKKNILITGGAGFIGSHLCDELIKKNRVICIDNFSTGNVQNIEHLLKNPDFKFIKHDIAEPLDLDSLPDLEPFKVAFQGVQDVYNLACPTSPKDYNKFPVETCLANSHGTKNALDWVVKYQSKFLHLSTSAVYGDPIEDQPLLEKYWGYIDPIGPRSCYNEGKRYAECLTTNYALTHKIAIKIARVFNTYGPRMRLTDGRMIPDFVTAAIENKDLIIYGDGKQVSSYCYIDDLVEGIIKFMNAEITGPINMGSPKVYTILDIANKIIEITGSDSKIVYKDPILFLAKQGVPDITWAKEKIGWFPIISLEDGLQRTIDYMKGSKAVGFEQVKI